jgi:hypothetical protein
MADRQGWAVGGVRILSIRMLSLRPHRWVWRAWIRFLVMPELGRNPGVTMIRCDVHHQHCAGGDAGAYGGPRLLSDRGPR